jgi:hypothetical protein
MWANFKEWAKATFQLMDWLFIASNFSWRIKNSNKRIQALAKSKNINDAFFGLKPTGKGGIQVLNGLKPHSN